MMKKIILFFITFLFIQPAFCFYLPETFFPGRQSCIYSEKCPKDKPFLKVTFNKNRGKTENIQETEECVGCDYLGECEQYEGHEHDLDICPNRRLIKTTDEDSTLRFINILKECPQGMIKRRDPPYECVSCMIKECTLESNECNKCPNRERVYRGGTRYDCRIKCPQNTFNAYDECVSCDTPEQVDVLYEEDCSCPNRFLEDERYKCVLKKDLK